MPKLTALTRPWWPRIEPFVPKILAAVEEGERNFHRARLAPLSLKARKHALTDYICAALLSSGIPFDPIPVGGSKFLVLRDVAVLRIKALDRSGKPQNAHTETAVAWACGDLIEHLPPLDRVDISYTLDAGSNHVLQVLLMEWHGRTLLAQHYLPWREQAPRSEEVLPLRFKQPARVRPKKGATRKAAEMRRAEGDEQK